MKLLECAARELQYFLSDFHYKKKVMDAKDTLYHLLNSYSIEEWIDAYQYIFYEEGRPNGNTAQEIYQEIFQRLSKEGTPLDPRN